MAICSTECPIECPVSHLFGFAPPLTTKCDTFHILFHLSRSLMQVMDFEQLQSRSNNKNDNNKNDKLRMPIQRVNIPEQREVRWGSSRVLGQDEEKSYKFHCPL